MKEKVLAALREHLPALANALAAGGISSVDEALRSIVTGHIPGQSAVVFAEDLLPLAAFFTELGSILQQESAEGGETLVGFFVAGGAHISVRLGWVLYVPVAACEVMMGNGQRYGAAFSIPLFLKKTFAIRLKNQKKARKDQLLHCVLTRFVVACVYCKCGLFSF